MLYIQKDAFLSHKMLENACFIVTMNMHFINNLTEQRDARIVCSIMVYVVGPMATGNTIIDGLHGNRQLIEVKLDKLH